uniref:50S ribosomal protein L6 n=1 Tax=mine drainage metagenome TaxID=410659 RepID=E6PSH7_9ZZZZ
MDARIADLETKIDLMKAELQESFRADLRKSLEYIKQLVKGV